jgi:CheY-like chemotaxis protein
VSLRILLADDSMTAQNMGKKILSDAGYEVTAVSNGAAALKKSTELKPDLVVLDIYMPGYTGLEVCERLKNAPDTAHIPVMLTVGKLEPYRPEEGARVRAEGVIIKPFEATDLLAAVQKISSSVAAPAPAAEPETPPAPPAPFVVAPLPVEMPTLSPEDVVGANPLDVSLPSFDAAGASHAAMPAFDIDPLRDFAVAPVEPAPQPLSLEVPEVVTPAAASAAAINLDFLRTPAEAPVAPEATTVEGFEPTSAPPVDVAGLELDYSLEPTHRPHGTSIDISADPSLVTDPADMSDFALKVGTDSENVGAAQPDPLERLVMTSEPEAAVAAPSQAEVVAEAPQPSFSMPPLTLNTSEAPRELDVVELFHEEYAPAADGSIDLSVPVRQTATPPPVPVYENAGVAGYAMTPAMRDYLERQEAAAAAASAAVVNEQAATPTAPLEVEVPEVSVAEAIAPEIVLPAQEPALEDSPLDVDALLAANFDLEPAAATAVPEPEVAMPEPEPETVQPETAPIIAETVPEPIDLIEELAPNAEPATETPVEPVVESIVEPPASEPVVELNEVAPVEVAPEIAEPTPIAEEIASPIADEVGELAPVAAEVAEQTEPTPEPEIQAEPAPVVAQIPGATPETLTGAADGLSAVDRARIAGVIQRVFDRYKPQIIADITRELMK